MEGSVPILGDLHNNENEKEEDNNDSEKEEDEESEDESEEESDESEEGSDESESEDESQEGDEESEYEEEEESEEEEEVSPRPTRSQRYEGRLIKRCRVLPETRCEGEPFAWLPETCFYGQMTSLALHLMVTRVEGDGKGEVDRFLRSCPWEGGGGSPTLKDLYSRYYHMQRGEDTYRRSFEFWESENMGRIKDITEKDVRSLYLDDLRKELTNTRALHRASRGVEM
jgi:flagellar biosynthesis GTPase FlhF